MEWIRKVDNRNNEIYMYFTLVDGFERYIDEYYSNEYKIPREEVKDLILGMVDRVNKEIKGVECFWAMNRSTITIRIPKKDKNGREIKKIIKKATRLMEELLYEFETKIQKRAEEVNLENWIWKKAVYDREKKRFVPSE